MLKAHAGVAPTNLVTSTAPAMARAPRADTLVAMTTAASAAAAPRWRILAEDDRGIETATLDNRDDATACAAQLLRMLTGDIRIVICDPDGHIITRITQQCGEGAHWTRFDPA